ncbi:hypothetical protein TNIN_456231 [Trichonephila inaurata madagascariensis]|uniref:Uncharacterized protein n=1 Tax=Trichonephila inaurata madagascariensis TaxID=2747483 RepID=A0A8X6X7Q9_9ARAC|nr:hypothetical protein TNIN_456231 [Trichonephila inaurata madagascariensis]
MISHTRTHGNTQERRMPRRQHQLDLLEATDFAEGPSYIPGIDDTIGSASQIKNKQTISARILYTVFENWKDILLITVLSKGANVKDERSCPILLKLQRAFQKKRSRFVNVVIHCNACRLVRLPQNSTTDVSLGSA